MGTEEISRYCAWCEIWGRELEQVKEKLREKTEECERLRDALQEAMETFRVLAREEGK